jgi:hypothetical protein
MNGRAKEESNEDKKVQLHVKSVLVRSDRSSRVTYASSPANALDDRARFSR